MVGIGCGFGWRQVLFGHADCKSFSTRFCSVFAARRWPPLQLDDVINHRISNFSVYQEENC